MKKTAQVIMFPTTKAIYKNNVVPFVINQVQTLIPDSHCSHPLPDSYRAYHLYLTSDDQINNGDWYVTINGNIYQSKGLMESFKSELSKLKEELPKDYYRKIIATTDKSLIINCINPARCDTSSNPKCDCKLPQIPESFIKAYIETQGNISEILVEYEYIKCGCVEYSPASKNCPICKGEGFTSCKLKVNLNNTVIIHNY